MKFYVIQIFGKSNLVYGFGGGLKTIMDMSKIWKVLGNEVTFITVQSREFVKTNIPEINSVNIPSDSFSEAPGIALLKSIKHFYLVLHIFKREFSKSLDKETLLISASHYPPDLLATFIISMRYKVNAVAYFHHLSIAPWHYPFKRGILRTWINYLLQTSALFLCKIAAITISLEHPEEAERVGWRLDKIIPLQGYVEYKRQAFCEERVYDGSYVGRISRSKGMVDLLKAWRYVTLQLPDAILVIGGTFFPDSSKVKFEKLVAKLNLTKNLKILGYVSESDKIKILRQSKTFVSASYEEGWGLAVMEAASFGAVPVTYDLDAYDYLGPTRVVAKIGDPEELAERIVEILKDEIKRKTIQRELKIEVDKYDLWEIAKSQLHLFNKIINRR